MKYAIIPIMALLMVGSVVALADNEQHVICQDCEEEQPQVVMVEEPERNDNDRPIDECNFDVERPRCIMHIWDRDKQIIVNDREISIDYDYRSSKDRINIGGNTYKMEESGAYYVGEFTIDGKDFKVMKGGSWRFRVMEV